MLLLLLTYHQIMPAFLDFVFPFGVNEHAQDFHFSQFRCEDTLTEVGGDLAVPDLERSGREIRLCYSLRSVEPSEGQRYWPWSIRQCAVYHSIDVDTGHSIWVIMKGNQLMKSRVMSTTESHATQSSPADPLCHAFASSLISHLLLADWSGENWRWYINHMENVLQGTTRHALSATVSSLPPAESSYKGETLVPIERGSPQHSLPEKSGALQPPLPPELPGVAGPSFRDNEVEEKADKQFSFEDLQKLQSLEEKANESDLVLKTNIGILQELRAQYGTVISSAGFPSHVRQECSKDVLQFTRHLASAEHNLVLQRSRIETLMRLLADRKSLVSTSFELEVNYVDRILSSMESSNTAIWKRVSSLHRELKPLRITWKT